MQLQISIILDRHDDHLASVIGELLNTSPMVKDFGFGESRILDHPTLVFSLYIDERLAQRDLQGLLSLLHKVKGSAERRQRRALQIIVDRDVPTYELLSTRNGIWISMRTAESFWRALQETGAERISSWFFLPFKAEDTVTDTDYESCPPDEKIRVFGSRINGSPNRASLPISLKIRLEEGYRITDYIAAAFEDSFGSFKELGGESVVLTTLLQMNDKLPLLNHYSEKLERSEELNLFSLSAMNLSLVDQREETNIAVLVSSGKLILKDVKLGG